MKLVSLLERCVLRWFWGFKEEKSSEAATPAGVINQTINDTEKKMNKSEQNIKGGSLISLCLHGSCCFHGSRSLSAANESFLGWGTSQNLALSVGVTTQLAPVFQTASADWFPSVQLCCGAATASQLHWLRQTNPLYAATLFRWVILCKATPICSCLPIHTYIHYIYILCICMHTFFFFLPPQVCLHFYGQICCWYLENDANEITRPLSPSSRGCPLRSWLWARGWCRQRRWSSPPKKLQKAASMNSSSSEAEASQSPPGAARLPSSRAGKLLQLSRNLVASTVFGWEFRPLLTLPHARDLMSQKWVKVRHSAATSLGKVFSVACHPPEVTNRPIDWLDQARGHFESSQRLRFQKDKKGTKKKKHLKSAFKLPFHIGKVWLFR